jgi:glucan phosphoethanolaminetransferase (alkaline phosphatase superfamily)
MLLTKIGGTNKVPTPVGICLLSLLIFVVISPNLVWFVAEGVTKNVLQERLLPGLATVGVLLSITRRLWVGALFIAPWAILASFESYYIFDFGKYSDAHLIGIISEADLAEASNFITGLFALLGGVALFTGCLVIAFIYLAFSRRWSWNGRERYWVLCACIFALCLPEIAKLNGPSRSLPIPEVLAARQFGAELADDHVPELFDYLLPVYPIGVLGRWYTYAEQRRALFDAKKKLADFQFGAIQEDSSDKRQIYVLVIGESGRPDHWQLNGYSKETTPLLVGIERVVSFRNAFSAWAWTRMSVPLMITRKSALDNNQFFQERSFITAFREAGFKTYWFSTQSPLGPHDSSIALHAAESHVTKFLNPLDYKSAGIVDGALLAPLDGVLDRGEPKVLIVLHTLGGHFNYADRYPEEFDKFQPSLKGVKGASLHKPAMKVEFNNSYDNSVLYLDYFLAEVIRRLTSLDVVASMFYMADHGENLFDGLCDKAGHGRGNEYDFRTPALWWSSVEYEKVHPAKVNAIKTRVDSPIATTDIFHSMLDSANIRYPDENLSRSLFSSRWKTSPRITQDKIDFDLAARDETCKKLLPTHQ